MLHLRRPPLSVPPLSLLYRGDAVGVKLGVQKGGRLIAQGIKDGVSLTGRLFEELTPEEIEVVLRVIDRIPGLLADHSAERRPRAIRRIPID